MTKTKSIIIGSSPDNRLLTLSALQPQEISGTSREIKSCHSTITRINPLLQALPNLVSSHEMGRTKYMQVVIDGTLAAAKDGDGLRAFSFDTNGKFSEHARLFDADRLSKIVTSGALLQIASVVVAQKHLADISKKLEDIKRGVDSIRAFQQDKRQSGILGSIEYLHQVGKAILQGEFAPSVRQRLEDCEVGLLAIQKHLESDLQQKIDAVSSVENPDTFGSKGITQAISRNQDEIEPLFAQWTLCIRARIVSWRLLASFPDEIYLKQARKDAIHNSIENFFADDGLLTQLGDQMKIKIDGISAFTEFQSTTYANKLSLHSWIDETFAAFHLDASRTRAQLQQGEAMLEEQLQPVVLALKLEDGKCIEAYRMESAFSTC